jgi:hypothetical protein
VNGNFTGSEEEQTKKRILISLHQFIEITNGNSIRAETKYSRRCLQCFLGGPARLSVESKIADLMVARAARKRKACLAETFR